VIDELTQIQTEPERAPAASDTPAAAPPETAPSEDQADRGVIDDLLGGDDKS